MKSFIAFLALVAIAIADHAPVYRPVYHPAPAYKEPAYAAPKYTFDYAVADDYAKLNYGHTEGRDGYATSGSYRVLLPDCRTQVVTYSTADGYSGNVVEVTYEGTPCVYDHKPAYHPAPVYKPAYY